MSKSASRKTKILSLAHAREPGRVIFPFTAIVGQEEMKLSLILNVIDPLIGGVLIMGHRGRGKSTTVRALSRLLPPVFKVKGCRYGCDPDQLTDLCTDCRARQNGRRRWLREEGAQAQ